MACACLSGTNARRVKLALLTLTAGVVGNNVVRHAWCKLEVEREAWSGRDLAREEFVRRILDGTAVKARIASVRRCPAGRSRHAKPMPPESARRRLFPQRRFRL